MRVSIAIISLVSAVVGVANDACPPSVALGLDPGCMKYNDGCNECSCDTTGAATCTERTCIQQQDPTCLDKPCVVVTCNRDERLVGADDKGCGGTCQINDESESCDGVDDCSSCFRKGCNWSQVGCLSDCSVIADVWCLPSQSTQVDEATCARLGQENEDKQLCQKQETCGACLSEETTASKKDNQPCLWGGYENDQVNKCVSKVCEGFCAPFKQVDQCDPPPICCKAMTAECLACAAGQTEKEYCEINIDKKIEGCLDPEPCVIFDCDRGYVVVGADDKGCGGGCRPDPEEPCLMVDCEKGFIVVGADAKGCGGDCKPKPRACCKALTASCLACAAGMSEDEYCTSSKNAAVVGCVSVNEPEPCKIVDCQPDYVLLGADDKGCGGECEPRVCCMAMTASCRACAAGQTEKEYCETTTETVQGCALSMEAESNAAAVASAVSVSATSLLLAVMVA